jgi:hypothetical protein
MYVESKPLFSHDEIVERFHNKGKAIGFVSVVL